MNGTTYDTHAYHYDMGLSVDGSPIPDPKGYKVIRSDLDTVGKRNANGKLIRNMVATKYKVEIEYENIDWTMITTIAKLFKNKSSFSLKFLDPFTNDSKTITAYCGDRESDTKWLPRDHAMRIGTLKVNCIEI